ncbi:unnamed protein product, partial [Porites evermanni]
TGSERVQLSTDIRLFEPQETFQLVMFVPRFSIDAITILTINEATDSEYEAITRVILGGTLTRLGAHHLRKMGTWKIWPFVPKWGGQCGGR